MKNGLTKLQREMHPVMVDQCLCAREITERIMSERSGRGDDRELLRTTILSTLRKLVSYGYIERQPGADSHQAVHFKVLPRFTKEMESKSIPTRREIKPLFITPSMALIGRDWVGV